MENVSDRGDNELCKGTVYGKDHSYCITRDKFNRRMKNIYKETPSISVDKCIGKEVEHLIKNGIVTIGHSCCGHGKVHGQVWIDKGSIKTCKNLDIQ